MSENLPQQGGWQNQPQELLNPMDLVLMGLDLMVLEIFWRFNDSMTLFAISLTGEKQHTNKRINFCL